MTSWRDLMIAVALVIGVIIAAVVLIVLAVLIADALFDLPVASGSWLSFK